MINSIKLSASERGLILDIENLEHGELFDVEIVEGEHTHPASLSAPRMKLIQTIREGIVSFSRIQVNNKEPTYAESDGSTRHGFRCRKRHKFI